MQTVYKAPVEANINFVDRETPNTNRYLFLIKPKTCGLQIDGLR